MGTFKEQQERRERLHQNTETLARAFLDISGNKRGYVCPICGHGKGTAKKPGEKNPGDGITFTPGGRWHCFSCGNKGDIIDLYMSKHGIGYGEAVNELEALLGVCPPVEIPKKEQGKPPSKVKAEFSALNFLPPIGPFRGISQQVLESVGARACTSFKNPLTAGTYHGARAVMVFPTAGGCYFVRALQHDDRERCDKWDIGGKRPFNLKALKGTRPVFLTEGVIDALSIMEAGGEAIGLSGIDGIMALVDVIKATPSPNGFILAPDNDEPGRNADWKAQLEAVGAECYLVDPAELYGGKKDANEALEADPKGLAERVAQVYASIGQVINPWGAGCARLIENVRAGAYEPISTGIPAVDNMLGGGFMPGQVVVITAPPARGKTAFCQSLAEGMAMRNRDFTCMYFCFEMSREQLQARSISRFMHQQGQDVSCIDIMQGKGDWLAGVQEYQQKVADRVVYLGLGSGLSSSALSEVLLKIREGLKYNASINRPAPFIVIDYLQLVDVDGKDEQEAIKATMGALKKLAVENNTVVLAIGANNRQANQKGEVSMYGGRGSSSIEYGADIVLALAKTDEITTEFMRKDTKLSLVVPKGRFYDPSARADFEFYGKYAEFAPVEVFGTSVTRKEQKDINSLLELDVR
jgi:replicative DNA helicase